MLVSGMHIGWGIVTPRLRHQPWHRQSSDTEQLIVILSWYVGAAIGCMLLRLVYSRWSKAAIYVSFN